MELELTDTHLIDKWTKGRQSSDNRIPLSKLSPDLSYLTARSENAISRLIGAIICLAIAITVFFSIIQEKVPLLSPFFCILSVWLLILGLRGFHLTTWTIINRGNGERFAYIVHEDCDEKERKTFEEAFTKRMKESNQPSVACDAETRAHEP